VIDLVRFMVGWALLIVGAVIVFHAVTRPSDPADPDPVIEHFNTAPRYDPDIARINDLFARIASEMPEQENAPDRLAEYYLVPEGETHG